MSTQKSPRAFYLVNRLQQLVSERLEAALEPMDITASQYTVLSVLSRHAPISSAELARRLRISAQSTGESVKGLEAKGLLTRHCIEENRRVLVLKMTSQGQRMLTRAHNRVADVEADFFKSLTDTQREQFEQTLIKVRDGVTSK